MAPAVSSRAYADRVSATLKKHALRGRREFKLAGDPVLKWDSPEEARDHLAQIRQLQSELYALKKEINSTTKAVRGSFTTRKARVRKGLGARLMARIFGGQTAGEVTQRRGEKVREGEQRQIAPYEDLVKQIDAVVGQLERARAELQGKAR